MQTESYKKRHQIRYEARCKKRFKRKELLHLEHSFEEMGKMRNWMKAMRKSQKGTSWKNSVQWYSSHPIQNTYNAMNDIMNDKYPYKVNTKRIVIRERGKERKIEPISIEKRHGEHVFCDEIYTPLLFPTLIYDNGASRVGMGVDFTRKRFEKFMNENISKYGDNFYLLKYDFKGYFESISYSVCENLLRDLFQDERCVTFAMNSITEYSRGNIILEKDKEKKQELIEKLESGNGNGICLGSQISQITALMIPNKIDHYIKDRYKVKHYNRFMDDGILQSSSFDFLAKLYDGCKELAEELKLKFNEKKTCIIKASRTFTFLKIRYTVVIGKNGTYHLLKRLNKKSIVRMRRKLKRFKHLLNIGKMTLDSIFDSFRSWYTNSKRTARSYHARKSMLRLYRSLFGNYKLYLLKNKYA